MMILPLPPFLLDVLLTINIAFSLSLLLSAVYLAQPGSFTVLPTVLLLTTLFRLGLNISTTRQLLAAGEAPEIVIAFGNFVVGGSLVVGAVVFIIVTVVQFLVIAKGAERVAEVAARFALDAMPGKQMSIDADVRSGALSLADAREKRRELQRESKLYGALDGAMKFVKGDAIAGVLITLINISAGLLLGVTHHGLSISEALSRYTIFTIGDGLVSQLPALLVAVAAGIAITRVEDRDDSFIGRDMLSQMASEPQALSTAAGVLLLLAFLPGLPTLPFLCATGAVAFAARRVAAFRNRADRERIQAEFRPKVLSSIVLRLSAGATVRLQQERTLPALVQRMRNDIFEKLGIIVPDIQFDVDYGATGIAATVFIRGVSLASVNWKEGGADFGEEVLGALESLVLQYREDFIDDTHTRMMLEAHQPVAEDLINSIVPSTISITGLTAIVKRLVRERVSVRELRTILQAIAEFKLKSDDGTIAATLGNNDRLLERLRAAERSSASEAAMLPQLLGEVRAALARIITRSLADDDWTVRVAILDPELDHLLAKAAIASAPLEPMLSSRVGQRLEEFAAEADGATTAVLTTKYARSLVADLAYERGLALAVIAPQEVSAEAKLKVVGRIGLDANSSGEDNARSEEERAEASAA